MKLWYKLQLCSRVNEIAWEYAEVIHRQWNTLEQKASSGRTPLLSVTRSFSFRTGPDTSHHLIYTGHEQITRLCRHLYCFLVYVIMVWSYVSYKHWRNMLHVWFYFPGHGDICVRGGSPVLWCVRHGHRHLIPVLLWVCSKRIQTVFI